jgi:acyl-CoA synthetase (AMP-forming)/AMP-acid ligase II
VIMTFKAEDVLRIIERESITCFHGGPTMLSMLVNHPDVHKHDLSSLRGICVTGSPLSAALWEKAEEILGPVINITYGLTETTGAGIILRRKEVMDDESLASEARKSSTGRPHVNMDVKVVDEEGKPVTPNGEMIGEIILSGDPVTKSYWNDPEETLKAIRGGWLYTGDAATIDEEGYITIVDRKGDMIKSGGMRIYPREIEEVIYTHPAVLYCSVIRVPDEKWGETPKALVVLKEGEHVTEKEIVDLCKKNLASYKKPTSVEFVDSMPMSDRGKILKRHLMERYWKNCEKGVH